jgi:hypothetical protein
MYIFFSILFSFLYFHTSEISPRNYAVPGDNPPRNLYRKITWAGRVPDSNQGLMHEIEHTLVVFSRNRAKLSFEYMEHFFNYMYYQRPWTITIFYYASVIVVFLFSLKLCLHVCYSVFYSALNYGVRFFGECIKRINLSLHWPGTIGFCLNHRTKVFIRI